MNMTEQFIKEFYENQLLPNFGISGEDKIFWSRREKMGPDDSAHYFSIDKKDYVLVYRDYDVFGDDELKEILNLSDSELQYIETKYGEKKLRVDFQLQEREKHIADITGTFVLLQLASL